MISLVAVTEQQIIFLLKKLTFAHEEEWLTCAKKGVALDTNLLLIMHNNVPTGFVLYSFTDPRTIYLDLIDVAEEYRNKGIACDTIACLFMQYKQCTRLQGQATCEALFFWCRVGAHFQGYTLENLHEAILDSEFPMFYLSRNRFELYYSRKCNVKA